MSHELVLASRWTQAENRRREALRAAHAQDAEALCDLLTFHLRLKSRRAGDVSEETLRSYTRTVRDFLAFVGPAGAPRHPLNQLDTEVVEAYLVHLRSRGLALTSVNTRLYGVRALCRALVWAGAIREDPARDVKAPRDPTPAHVKKRALPNEAVKRLQVLPQERHGTAPTAARDAALLALGMSLGLRAHEIVALDVSDVDTRLGEVHVRHGKGGKSRRVPLGRTSAATLERWCAAREALRLRGKVADDERALFVSFRPSVFGKRLTTRGLGKIVNAYFSAAGLPPDMFGVHTLRRTAGTRLYRATRDLHVVADILGHASISTSAIYAKMDADIRREALEKAEDL